MGYLLTVVIWGVIGAIPGAAVGVLVVGAAWLYAYGESAPVNLWWFWGPLVAGAVIGVFKGLSIAGEPYYRPTPKVDTDSWRLEEIRRSTELSVPVTERGRPSQMRRTATAVLVTAALATLASCAPVVSDATNPSPASAPSAEETPSPSPTPTSSPTPSQAPEAELGSDESFMAALRLRSSLASATQQADQSVFIEWGQYQCDALRDGGAAGMLGSTVAWGFVEGEVEDLEEGLLDELHVTGAAATYLCPDLKPVFDEFMVLLEHTLNGG